MYKSDVQVPTVETDRLRLRGHRIDDFTDCAAMWADPVVTRYIGGKPSSEQQTWARLLNYVGHWALLGFGYWVIEDKSTRAFFGELGFADFRRDMQPSIKGLPELGWALAPRCHGKGYATEAVRAALAWGDASLKSPKTVCIIDPDNLASIRVAAKHGFRQATQTSLNGQPTILFERTR